MRISRTGQLIALLAAACSADPPHQTLPTANSGAAARTAPAQTAPAAEPSTEPAGPTATPPAPVPLPPEVASQVQTLANRFANPGGRPQCDTDALAALRLLREQHGTPPLLLSALQKAFAACQEHNALAELLAQNLPPDAPLNQSLSVGAAWIRAARYPEAAAHLLPLAEQQGPDSKAAWLAGFALFHGGDSARALPLLTGARAQAGRDADGFLLVGLAKLHTGDADGAIEELNAGRTAAPDNRSVLSALARAYTAAGREEDAARISAEARAVHDAIEVDERKKAVLSARATALRIAWDAARYDEVETLLQQMWDDAPPTLRTQLLQRRIALYERTERPDEAAAARKELAALQDTSP